MHRNLHLDDIIPKLPSLDWDLLSSDNEEEKSVLQRPEVLLLPEGMEVDLCVSLKEPEIEGPLKSVTQSFIHSADDDYKDDCNFQPVTDHTSEGSQTTSVSHKTDRNDLFGWKSQSYPILSSTPFNDWDLDHVLQTFKQNKHLVKPIQHDKPKDNVNEKCENTVMERLVAFSEKQANKMERKTDISFMKIYDKERLLLREQMKDFKGSLPQLLNQDSPTVYIDLCNNKLETKQTAVIHSKSLIGPKHLDKKISSMSHTNARADERKWELTGKSFLLQAIRQSEQNVAEMSESKRNPHNLAEPQQKNISEIKKKQFNNSETSCSEPACVQQADITAKHQTQSAATTYTPLDVQLQNKQSSKAQRQQHSQKVRLQKDLKFLQEFKTPSSANEKDKTAEKTDVLYNPEAACLHSVNTLPPYLQTRECLVLTVSMSIPGVVTGRAQRKAQRVDSVSLNSHVYNTLVAWFLSLTEPNAYNGNRIKVDIPFWVAGLQQFYAKDGLALYVCAISTDNGRSVCKKSRGKDMEKDQSIFHRRVCKFFSQTSLKTVAFWVPQLNRVLEKQTHHAQVHLPSSYLDCFISVNPNQEAVEKIFGMTPGFFWQTVKTKDQKCERAEATNSQECHTETAFALICSTLYLNPLAMHHTFELIYSAGLDICGLRFLYPTLKLLTNFAVGVFSGRRDCSHQSILALSLRGPHAKSLWREITGPSDPQLAKKTDPASINALYCHSHNQPLLYSPHLPNLVHLGLCVWFSGRIANSSPAVSDQFQYSGDGGDRCFHVHISSPATLCATVEADIFLLVSPVVGPHCYSHILSTCVKRGFSLLGLQRVQISTKQAQSIGLTAKQVAVFCHAPAVFLDGEQVELSSQCLLMLMRRESAVRHCSGLTTGLMNELAAQGFIGSIHARLKDDVILGPHLCFHTLPYSKTTFNVIGAHMWTVPDFRHVVLSKHRYLSCPDTEQVVILLLSGQNTLEKEMGLLHKVLKGDAAGHTGFELLALKWLPNLSKHQARELSPFEVGDRDWQSSVLRLMSIPVLIIALRRINAFSTLRRLLPQNYPGNLDILMSPTPETAFRQTCLFFSETELIPDHSSRPSLKFLPPAHTLDLRSQSLYSYMTVGPELLFTLALFKPGVWRHCFGKILSMIKQNGFTLVGLRVLLLDSNVANALMHSQEQQDLSERKMELKYLRSGPSLALCLMRVNAVMKLLELMGPEDPAEARTIDQNMWRACYGSDKLHNGLYGSLSYGKAIQDIKLVFPEGVCSTETSVLRRERVSKQIQCLRSDPEASLEREQSHMLRSAVKDQFSQSSGFCEAGPLVCSGLCQITCLLIPFHLLRQNQILELLDRLLRTDCHLVAGRLSTPDEKQRRHTSKLLGSAADGAFYESLLSEGPCLIIALQRHNADTCFNVILESVYRERPDLESVRMKLLHPDCERGAEKMLCYLFDCSLL